MEAFIKFTPLWHYIEFHSQFLISLTLNLKMELQFVVILNQIKLILQEKFL